MMEDCASHHRCSDCPNRAAPPIRAWSTCAQCHGDVCQMAMLRLPFQPPLRTLSEVRERFDDIRQEMVMAPTRLLFKQVRPPAVTYRTLYGSAHPPSLVVASGTARWVPPMACW